jgi:signal transduction histidine kinase
MTPQILDRLFTPFTQGESASSRCYGGTSLGVATAGRLVQLMQGSMDVESQPGQGRLSGFFSRSNPPLRPDVGRCHPRHKRR